MAIAASITRATAVAVNVFRIGWIRGSHPRDLPQAFLPCVLWVGLAKGGQGRGGRATVWLDQYRTRLLWRSRWLNYHPFRSQSPPRTARPVTCTGSVKARCRADHWSTFPVATLSRGTSDSNLLITPSALVAAKCVHAVGHVKSASISAVRVSLYSYSILMLAVVINNSGNVAFPGAEFQSRLHSVSFEDAFGPSSHSAKVNEWIMI